MKRLKRLCALFVLLSFLSAAGGIFCDKYIDRDMHFTPAYEKIDLAPLLAKAEFSIEDYKTLFYQTGLGRPAVDALRQQEDFAAQIASFQEDFFAPASTQCYRAGISTKMEHTVDANGRYCAGFSLAPYEEGDVVAMFSSHSFGWRHGHAGLIIGSNRVLEAPILGVPAGKFRLNTWREYPTFVLLRLKDASSEELAAIADAAVENLNGVTYSPFAGVLQKYGGRRPPTTQCAHLVWHAFYTAGYDIDCTGGNIVTVWDIVDSNLFEVVQIYGLNPDRLWRE